MTLEESLRTLADDEARVPPHVDAAVMAAWDDFAGRVANRSAASPAAARLPRATAGPQRRSAGSRAGRWPAWVVACAAIVVVAVVISWRTVGDDSGRAARASAPLIQRELVLVPELEGTGPLALMRLRMTRREFSRLGIPISNPEGDGLVDVEVLVGEDGVARSIRRAVAVGWTAPNR
jgi:hypothetical protein